MGLSQMPILGYGALSNYKVQSLRSSQREITKNRNKRREREREREEENCLAKASSKRGSFLGSSEFFVVRHGGNHFGKLREE